MAVVGRQERAMQEEQQRRQEMCERFRQLITMFGPEAVQVEYILSDRSAAPEWLKEYIRELVNG